MRRAGLLHLPGQPDMQWPLYRESVGLLSKKVAFRLNELDAKQPFAFRKDTRKFQVAQISQWPDALRDRGASEYIRIAKRKVLDDANVWLRNATTEAGAMKIHDLDCAWPDGKLSEWAKERAALAEKLLQASAGMDAFEALVEPYGFDMPESDYGDEPIKKRLADAAWWKGKARRVAWQTVEKFASTIGWVSKARQCYVSDFTLNRRQAQNKRNRAFMERTIATSDQGDEMTLWDIQQKSISNKKLQRNELMTRCRGFEDVAEYLEHVAMFYTLTCPSRFHRHRTLKHGGVIDNKKWFDERLTPSDAQKYLSCVFAKIRAELARKGLRIYGFRVAEVHHDGCPHWHFLLFMEPAEVKAVTDIFREYALEDSPKECAHNESIRFDVKDNIEPGRATGYIAKYIAKAIDGDFMDADPETGEPVAAKDLFGNDAASAAERVQAACACHRIRQFQQIGGPSVTVWRELRRAASANLDLFDDESGKVRACLLAADEASWFGFCMAMGGPFVRRKEQTMRPLYCLRFDEETGECEAPLNKYGEPREAGIMGVSITENNKLKVTRTRIWTMTMLGEAAVKKCGTQAAPIITARAPASDWAPWAVVGEIHLADALKEVEEKAPAELERLQRIERVHGKKFWRDWVNRADGLDFKRRERADLEFCQ